MRGKTARRIFRLAGIGGTLSSAGSPEIGDYTIAKNIYHGRASWPISPRLSNEP